jgi:hypothetical protein
MRIGFAGLLAMLLAVPGLQAPAASALEEPSNFRPELTGVHPRLLIHPAMQPELERRASDPDYESWYTRIIQKADSAPPTVNWFDPNVPEGTDGNWERVSWRLPTYALAYRLTNNPAYAEVVRSHALQLTDEALFPEWGGEMGGSMANAMGLIGVGYAYDWAYDLWSEAEKAQIRGKLKRQAEKLYRQFSENLNGNLAYWKHDYQNNHMHKRIEALLVATAAIYGDEADPKVEEMFRFAERELANMLDWIAPDGSNHEGPSYLPYGFEHVVRAVAVYESVTGIGLWNDAVRNMAVFKFYQYGPGFTTLSPYGDDNGTLYYFNNFLYKIAAQYQDGVLQSYANKAFAVDPGSFDWEIWNFLYYDDALAPIDQEMQTWKYFPDLEYANFRTGWDPDDLSIHLKSGPPGGHRLNEWRDLQGPDSRYVNVAHDKPDAGNFNIQFGGKKWGEYSPYDQLDRWTKYTNTLLVDGAGQHGEMAGAWMQPFDGMRDEARMTEFFGSPGYGVAIGDAHRAYDGLSKFNRHVLMIDGRYFVVYDDVASDGPARDYEFLFHNRGQWSGDIDSGYVIDQDGAAMELYMPLPTARTATVEPAPSEKKKWQGVSTLKVRPAEPAVNANFLAVFVPRMNGLELLEQPQAVQDAQGTKLTVKRNDGLTDWIAVRPDTGPISAPGLHATARALIRTVNAHNNKTVNAVMVDGTRLQVNGFVIQSSVPINVRYEKRENGFTLWLAKPLLSDHSQASIRMSRLGTAGSHHLKVNGSPVEKGAAGPGGNAMLDLDLSGEVRVDVTTGNEEPPQAEKPGPANTGPSDPSILVPHNGTYTITQSGVYENLHVTGAIKIQADNVTLRNFKIDGNGALYGLYVNFGKTGIVIEDGEITDAKSAAVIGGGFTARRLNIHDIGGDAFKTTGDVTVEHSWFHHLGTTPGQHADGNQTRQGSHFVFRYNNCDMPITVPDPYKSNACFQIETAEGAIDDVLIEHNWLNGGNYTIQIRDSGNGAPTNVRILNNRFGRDYRYGLIKVNGGPHTISGNVWDDTGLPIDPL